MSSIARTRRGRSARPMRYASRVEQDIFVQPVLRQPGREDPRLTHVTKVCLSHAGASRYLAGCGARFQVRSEPFAYYLDNHRGQGIAAVCVRQRPADVRALRRADAVRYDAAPSYVGWKGWVAVRLDVGDVNWDEVARLAAQSYARTASGEW
jgi:hypothetical protein